MEGGVERFHNKSVNKQRVKILEIGIGNIWNIYRGRHLGTGKTLTFIKTLFLGTNEEWKMIDLRRIL